jgi:NitT/TauT family transport system permease protein
MSMLRLRKLLMQISGILFVILLWEIATGVLHLFKPIILPSPDSVLLAAISLAQSGELFEDASWSLLRVLLGFAVAAVVAIPVGVVMGWSRTASYIVDPVVEIMRPIPPIAWIGLAILWFGLGLNSAIFLVFIGAFFPILLNTISGVRNVDKKLIEVAYTFGALDHEILRKVVIPAALPTIYTGLRVGMGIGWMCVVAAEMINPQHGLGDLILSSSSFLRTDRVMVGMISIGILGLVINVIFQLAGDRLFAWQKGISKGGEE